MDDLIEYFTDIFHLEKHVSPPKNIISKLNSLDRAERGELKSRLFTEAKRLGSGGDALRAIRWLESVYVLIESNTFRLHEVLFSPGQDIPENLAFYLSQAKKTIDLCIFTISDDKLSHCIKAMHSRGIRVRIITDDKKMRDAGSQIRDFVQYGIPVKVDNSKYHMHNKFGIIDGRIAFTGSYNWTYTAKAYNQENLVITTNYLIVKKFVGEFGRLWDQMFLLRPHSAKKNTIGPNDRRLSQSRFQIKNKKYVRDRRSFNINGNEDDDSVAETNETVLDELSDAK